MRICHRSGRVEYRPDNAIGRTPVETGCKRLQADTNDVFKILRTGKIRFEIASPRQASPRNPMSNLPASGVGALVPPLAGPSFPCRRPIPVANRNGRPAKPVPPGRNGEALFLQQDGSGIVPVGIFPKGCPHPVFQPTPLRPQLCEDRLHQGGMEAQDGTFYLGQDMQHPSVFLQGGPPGTKTGAMAAIGIQ